MNAFAARVPIIRMQARRIMRVVEAVEDRCLMSDGPVTPTLKEMTERELRQLWRAAKAIAKEVK